MTTDFNHNKAQHGSKPALLNPWQLDGSTSPNSRPRSYSLGCHPQEIRDLLSKRGLGTLEISLDSFNACPKRKSSTSNTSGYLKKSFCALLLISLISLVFYAYVAWTYNASIVSLFNNKPGGSVKEVDANLVPEELGADEEIMIEELGEITPKMVPHREINREKRFTHIYGSTRETEDPSHDVKPNYYHQPNQGMQHSYRHQGSHIGHHSSFVHRHYPHQHTGVYYVHQHPNAHVQQRMHANNHLLGHLHHNEMARQSWLVEHMRHQQPAGDRSYTWETSNNRNNEQLKEVSNNKATLEKQSGDETGKLEANVGIDQMHERMF